MFVLKLNNLCIPESFLLLHSPLGGKKTGQVIISRESKHFLEIFKIQVDVIILPQVADRFQSIGWVPVYWLGSYSLVEFLYNGWVPIYWLGSFLLVGFLFIGQAPIYWLGSYLLIGFLCLNTPPFLTVKTYDSWSIYDSLIPPPHYFKGIWIVVSS